MLVVHLFAFALDHPPPACVVLISGDIDFALPLAALRLRGYCVVLMRPTSRVRDQLVSAADHVLFFRSASTHQHTTNTKFSSFWFFSFAWARRFAFDFFFFFNLGALFSLNWAMLMMLSRTTMMTTKTTKSPKLLCWHHNCCGKLQMKMKLKVIRKVFYNFWIIFFDFFLI